MLLSFITAMLRKFGLLKEKVHHIEDDFFSLAKRFEAAAGRELNKAEGAAAQIDYFNVIETQARQASLRAKNNAKKVRDFFV